MAAPTPSLLRSCLAGLLGIAALGVCAAAHANPAVEACAGKNAGDACGRMQLVKPEGGGELQRKTVPGVCVSDECCDLDYSKGSPPETVCHACLACKDGPSDSTPAAANAGPAPGDGGGEGEPPRAGEQDPPAPSPQKRGCRVASPRSGVTGWAALGGLLLLRRRNRD
ncbi:MAG: hypothetical protein AAGF11_40185 [Myxococcota bacterium]